MSVHFLCDGCEVAVEKPTIVGYVVQRHYCEECAVKAEDFLQQEECIRKTFYDEFNASRTELLKKFNGFKLPDV